MVSSLGTCSQTVVNPKCVINVESNTNLMSVLPLNQNVQIVKVNIHQTVIPASKKLKRN